MAAQKAAAAQQEYFAALDALLQQIGNPEYAVAAEPVGDIRCPDGVTPGGEDALIDAALASQPEIRAARGPGGPSRAALCLAAPIGFPFPPSARTTRKTSRAPAFTGCR